MSVQVLDPKTYESVFEKAVSYTFTNVININFCETFNKMTEKQIAELIKTWLNLNEESYDVAYKEQKNETPLSYFLNLNFNTLKCKRINTYQMLKTLECINYNIEAETIEEVRPLTEQEKEAIKLLQTAINRIKTAIIKELPEYNAAKWGDFE